MTDFTRTNVPLSINTYEKLVVWAMTCLEVLNPSLKQIEDENLVEKAVQVVQKTSPDGVPLMIMRTTLSLDANYQSSTLPIWMSAKVLSNAIVPAAWTTGS